MLAALRLSRCSRQTRSAGSANLLDTLVSRQRQQESIPVVMQFQHIVVDVTTHVKSPVDLVPFVRLRSGPGVISCSGNPLEK